MLFIALDMATCLGAMVVHDWWVEESEFGWDRGINVGPLLGTGIGLSAFGLYVAFSGFRGQRAKGRRRCPKCWYLIDPALGRKCSECGHESKRERDLYRPRRQWNVAALGMTLIGLGQLGWLESRVRSGGWVAAVPTALLVLGMPWWPEEWIFGEDSLLAAPNSQYDEDWSLASRIFWIDEGEWGDPHAWRWHEDFTVWRARGLMKPTASPESNLRALALAHDVRDDWDGIGEETPWLSQSEARAVIGAVLNSLDSGDPRAAQACDKLVELVAYSGAWRGDAWMPEVVEPRAERLIEIVSDVGHPYRSVVIILAGYLADRPGLVDALGSAATDGNLSAVNSLVALADRSAAAFEVVIELLQSPQTAVRVARFIAIHHPMHPGIPSALRALLASEDAALQQAGAIAA